MKEISASKHFLCVCCFFQFREIEIVEVGTQFLYKGRCFCTLVAK